MSKTEYCVGFLFDERYHPIEEVLLIRKLKPQWQAGRLNGIGGHLEKDETSLQAMCREFKEETGAEFNNWDLVCILEGEDFILNVFRGFTFSVILYILTLREQGFKTPEGDIGIYKVSEVNELGGLPNLNWLIPMCLHTEKDVERGQGTGMPFRIYEHGAL